MPSKCSKSFDRFLQEISNDLRPVRQQEIEDLIQCIRVLRPSLAKEMCVRASEQLKMRIRSGLEVGVPVESGPFHARLERGRLVLTDEECDDEFVL
jgi:uncharacterized protein (DUF2267 family)